MRRTSAPRNRITVGAPLQSVVYTYKRYCFRLQLPTQYMMLIFFGLFHRRTVIRALLCFLLGCSAAVWGQQQRQRLSYEPSAAIDPANSRAEQAAEQMVSLSADKIIAVLREEAGLLIQVKKALVRKAFEQGRILDPDDLTDEALFRLLREDANIRVIATREIEDRSYIRAKPTREEIARNLPCRPPVSLPGDLQSQAKTQDQSSSDLIKRTPSQEDAYWLKHESDLDCYLTQYLPFGTAQSLYAQPRNTESPSQQTPASSYPQQQYPQPQNQQPQSPQQQYPPSQTTPQGAPTDSRHQLELTQTQPFQGYFGVESEESGTVSMQPDELPSLLSASQTGGLSGFSKNGMKGAASLSGSMTQPSLESALGSSMGSLAGLSGASGFPREASLENQSRFPLQPYSAPKKPQQPMLRHRPNPYADVPSLYDLYAQYTRRAPMLERFGEDIFRNGTGNLDQLPMDLPAGPDYVVGPGDGLTINLTGGISERLQKVVDREGRVSLPEVGGVEVSGRSLGEVQHLVQTVLRGQFRGVDADVSL